MSISALDVPRGVPEIKIIALIDAGIMSALIVTRYLAAFHKLKGMSFFIFVILLAL
jgi:hypothetical protein